MSYFFVQYNEVTEYIQLTISILYCFLMRKRVLPENRSRCDMVVWLYL